MSKMTAKKRMICGVVIFAVIFGIGFLGWMFPSYNSWQLKTMKINNLWTYSKGNGQVIAIIDTGISDELLEQLGDRVIYCYNVIDGNDDVSDMHGHGTEMVSVACLGQYKSVTGIAPETGVIIIKAVSDEGKTNNDYLYSAFKLALENGATVVNVSIGGFKSDERLQQEINNMIEKNISIVAAAGDYGQNDLLYPANYDGVISVEASSEDGNIWENSNSSEKSILRMPGTEIQVLTRNSSGKIDRITQTGTSESCAIASGYIALLRSYYEQKGIPYDNAKIIDILQDLNTKGSDKVNYSAPFKVHN